MIKWLKSRTTQEKVMIALIIVLIIGVILRWDYIKDQAGVWFRGVEPKEQVETVE